ncbi:RraA family protein [Asticcacaulis sp. 201]|uniref:RraA family protein n=1 Tax=Asticcacaulis sp. 201 TaxID=3028787 RepID=UPI00291697F0|nr:RraA family protein [Asticcacaulis sp. 201]MDV6330848.1 RraA family protein [Asticcacaulis sp. 201]
MDRYQIHPMPTQAPADLVTRLSRLHTSTFGHTHLWGFCRRDIRPLTAASAVAGTAVTVALPGPDSTLLHQMLAQVRPGDVVMIDRLHDDLYACIGGIVALAMKRAGVTAVVVDGPITDTAEILAVGLPVWSRGVSALTTRRLNLGGRLNTPVSISGAVVTPGDLVLCDADGVFILPAADAKAAIDHAEAREAWESRIVAEVASGRDLADALKACPPR